MQGHTMQAFQKGTPFLSAPPIKQQQLCGRKVAAAVLQGQHHLQVAPQHQPNPVTDAIDAAHTSTSKASMGPSSARMSSNISRRRHTAARYHAMQATASAGSEQVLAPSMLGLKAAYQGVPGAYSEVAAHKGCPGYDTLPCDQFEVAFQALSQWMAERAVLPIENSLGGSIHAVYDLLLRYRLHIVGETSLAINHCLAALPGTNVEHIKRVMSHPQVRPLS
ncbi:Prephenate dehydratase-domain-containing protein [Dunaliella salina]|uniref:Prephenate dehydratase-domain-containing protein n=1 Tax=Dunaliella salina TaxID=3046 RepID=A0ABQ7H5M6_DUNSA|nr:Prephenate dehydratase-domain-containing protein [Dunaliella salina]|eukprot:KAF5842136.1 Prephenate dehydratase-domain-containing protein [Dunaliella salina]